MLLKELMQEEGLSQHSLSVKSGVPYAMLDDLLTGKSKIERCTSETVYKLAKTLGVSMEILIEDGIRISQREKSYEYGLPEYLQRDLDAYKEGVINHSNLLDCYWGELYGSINTAEIDDGAISSEHANYLRNKFLWRKTVDE